METVGLQLTVVQCAQHQGKHVGSAGKHAGHYERCCRAKGQSQVQEVDWVESGLGLEPMRINVIGGQTSAVQYRRCDCELAGVHVSLVIDLGAKVSILSKAPYDQWFRWCKLQQVDRQLVGYVGSPIKVLGRVKLIKVLGRVKHALTVSRVRLPEFQFYVTASGTDILGLDLFDALGFQICWEQQELASHTLQSVDMLETVEDKAIREDLKTKWPAVFNGLQTGTPAEAAERRCRGLGGKASVHEKVRRSEETSCVGVYSRQLGADEAPVERSQVDVTAVPEPLEVWSKIGN